jgi:hypothetical protein
MMGSRRCLERTLDLILMTRIGLSENMNERNELFNLKRNFFSKRNLGRRKLKRDRFGPLNCQPTQELLEAVTRIKQPKTKFDVLTLKSAAELLYYLRDYGGALEVGGRVLAVATDQETYVGSSERGEVEELMSRCRRRINGEAK